MNQNSSTQYKDYNFVQVLNWYVVVKLNTFISLSLSLFHTGSTGGQNEVVAPLKFYNVVP